MEKIEVLSIHVTEYGMDVKLHTSAQGNLALIGILEKIKLTILENFNDDIDTDLIAADANSEPQPSKKNKTNFKYDA